MDPQPDNQNPPGQPQGEFQGSQPVSETQPTEQPLAPQPPVDQPQFQESAPSDTAPFSSAQPTVVPDNVSGDLTNQVPVGAVPVAPVPKKSPAKAIVIAVVSLLVAALIAVGVWFMFFRTSAPETDSKQSVTPVSISEADYKQADTDLAALRASYDEAYGTAAEKLPNMVRQYNSVSDDNDVASLKQLFEDYKQKSDSFSKLNALKDKDIKQNYDDFVKQNEQFVVFMDGFFDSVPALKGTEACGKADMSGYTDETALKVFDKAFAPCSSAIDGMIKSRNIVISKYGTTTKGLLDQMRALHEDLQNAALAHDTTARDNASQQILQLDGVKSTESADKEMGNDIQSVDLTDQLKSLQDALKNKVS